MTSVCCCVFLFLWSAATAAQLPALRTILVAPNTAFAPNDSVNLAAIAFQARFAKDQGANTVWVLGSLGEFSSLTVDERKAVATEWVKEGKKKKLFVIIQVGSTSVEISQILAEHAHEIGADAISAVPPFYAKPTSVEDLVTTMSIVASAAPDLPFYYYHIPGMTGVDFPMFEFFNLSQSAIPNLRGVKYVSSDMYDYLRCLNTNWTIDYDFMWAPEPKLASFGLGARSFVIAESFFVHSLLRMWNHWIGGDQQAAQQEQMWRWSVGQIMSRYGVHQSVMKAILTMIGVPVGVPVRLPLQSISMNDYEALRDNLTRIGFFDQF